MFGKKKQSLPTFDPQAQEPVLKRSICTGETTAGFKDRKTGHYHEVMLIRTPKDLAAFMKQYGISEPLKTEY